MKKGGGLSRKRGSGTTHRVPVADAGGGFGERSKGESGWLRPRWLFGEHRTERHAVRQGA